jgi:hypothetical protein
LAEAGNASARGLYLEITLVPAFCTRFHLAKIAAQRRQVAVGQAHNDDRSS